MIKPFCSIYRTLQLIFTVFVLTSLLSLTACNSVLDNSTANSTKPSPTVAKEKPQPDNLPDSIAQAVLQDVSQQENLSKQELYIVSAEPRNWPDGCLGVASSDTFCTQVVVPGWQVTAEGGQQNFVYRTNASGSLVKRVKE